MRHRSRREHTPRTRRTPSKRRRQQRVTRYRPSRAEPPRFSDTDATLGPQGDTDHGELVLSAPYAPTIASHAHAAHHGVQLRLFGAAASGLVAALASASLLLFTFQTYALLMVSVIAGGCALVTITLAMSARKEEEVHQLAASLAQHTTPDSVTPQDHASMDGNL